MTMKTTWPRTVLGALALVASCLPAARADFELKDAQGRSILLKDDRTWRYLDSAAAGDAASAPAKDQPQAELMLEQRQDVPGGCRFEFVLTNTLPYEIGSLVPQFTVYRANDVAYNAQTASFGRIRPGDQSRRALRFGGIACAEGDAEDIAHAAEKWSVSGPSATEVAEKEWHKPRRVERTFGLVEQVHARRGDTIRKGQVLVERNGPAAMSRVLGPGHLEQPVEVAAFEPQPAAGRAPCRGARRACTRASAGCRASRRTPPAPTSSPAP